MPLKIPIHLRSQIRELIPFCCNHTDGRCLLLGGPCAQAVSESRIVCKYFRDFILPGKPELCKEMIHHDTLHHGRRRLSGEELPTASIFLDPSL